MNGWKSMVALGALWAFAIMGTAERADADCAAPAQEVQLTLEEVTHDGVVLSDTSEYDGLDVRTVASEDGPSLHSGDYSQWFSAQETP